jgi:hypothetical protein
MSCCGKKREEIAAGNGSWDIPARYDPPPRHRSATPPATPAVSPSSSVTLLRRDRGVISVGGPVTGKRYQFSGAGSMQSVDRRDAEALLATGSFERVWG